MLVSVISFEIPNRAMGTVDEFVIENTIENQEKVFSNRFTRAIKFFKMFDFELVKKMKMPASFIDPRILIALLSNAIKKGKQFVQIAMSAPANQIRIDFTKAIEFGKGWNCCKKNATHVIVFDNGVRWGVCTACANQYPGPVYTLESQFVPVAEMV
jgi:hypothetical protein